MCQRRAKGLQFDQFAEIGDVEGGNIRVAALKGAQTGIVRYVERLQWRGCADHCFQGWCLADVEAGKVRSIAVKVCEFGLAAQDQAGQRIVEVGYECFQMNVFAHIDRGQGLALAVECFEVRKIADPFERSECLIVDLDVGDGFPFLIGQDVIFVCIEMSGYIGAEDGVREVGGINGDAFGGGFYGS